MQFFGIIQLTGKDAVFAKMAQLAAVTGATLPAGTKIPKSRNRRCEWIIFGSCAVYVNKESFL